MSLPPRMQRRDTAKWHFSKRKTRPFGQKTGLVEGAGEGPRLPAPHSQLTSWSWQAPQGATAAWQAVTSRHRHFCLLTCPK